MDYWLGGLQKGLEAAQKQAQEAAAQASVLAQQATAQAKIYADQATEKAKVLAKQAAAEAQAQMAHIKAAASQQSAGSASSHDPAFYGISDMLVERVSNMNYTTFTDAHAPPQDASTSGNQPPESFRLNPWQEKHALLILTKVEQLQNLRFALCPKRMDEQQFWTTYFSLVKDLLPPQADGLEPIKIASTAATITAVEPFLTREAPVSDAQPRGGVVLQLMPSSSSQGAMAADLSEAVARSGSSGEHYEQEEGGNEEEEAEDLDDEDLAAGLAGADDLDLDLDDDPELAQYLEEALALEDEDQESGDLGDDLDDYISRLQEQEEHGADTDEVLTPRDGVDKE